MITIKFISILKRICIDRLHSGSFVNIIFIKRLRDNNNRMFEEIFSVSFLVSIFSFIEIYMLINRFQTCLLKTKKKKTSFDWRTLTSSFAEPIWLCGDVCAQFATMIHYSICFDTVTYSAIFIVYFLISMLYLALKINIYTPWYIFELDWRKCTIEFIKTNCINERQFCNCVEMGVIHDASLKIQI